MQWVTKIGTNKFKIVWQTPVVDDNDKVVWGHIDSTKDVIKVDSGIALPRRKEALLHECVHGVGFSMGDDLEEPVVTRLSLGLYRWMLDNKSLVKWLIE